MMKTITCRTNLFNKKILAAIDNDNIIIGWASPDTRRSAPKFKRKVSYPIKGLSKKNYRKNKKSLSALFAFLMTGTHPQDIMARRQRKSARIAAKFEKKISKIIYAMNR